MVVVPVKYLWHHCRAPIPVVHNVLTYVRDNHSGNILTDVMLCHLSVCASVNFLCLLHNSDTVQDIFLKLGTNINHHQTMCREQEPTLHLHFLQNFCTLKFFLKRSCLLYIFDTHRVASSPELVTQSTSETIIYHIYCIKSTQIFQRRISLRCNESNKRNKWIILYSTSFTQQISVIKVKQIIKNN